jgi:chromosomal replication initiation ATPase DnaA
MPRRPVGSVVEALRLRDLLELVEQVAACRGVPVDELCGLARTQSVSRARQEAWWRLRHHPERNYSLEEIGKLFGRHHTTVMAGVAAHARRLERVAAPAQPSS